MRYQRIPEYVEAIQYTGSNNEEINDWIKTVGNHNGRKPISFNDECVFFNAGPDIRLFKNYWIVKSITLNSHLIFYNRYSNIVFEKIYTNIVETNNETYVTLANQTLVSWYLTSFTESLQHQLDSANNALKLAQVEYIDTQNHYRDITGCPPDCSLDKWLKYLYALYSKVVAKFI